jgi:hypothetical protein
MAGHQRTADTPADGGRADTPAGGGQADTGGGRYTTDGHTCLRDGGREDTEGAPTWRQGKVYQHVCTTVVRVYIYII